MDMDVSTIYLWMNCLSVSWRNRLMAHVHEAPPLDKERERERRCLGGFSHDAWWVVGYCLAPVTIMAWFDLFFSRRVFITTTEPYVHAYHSLTRILIIQHVTDSFLEKTLYLLLLRVQTFSDRPDTFWGDPPFLIKCGYVVGCKHPPPTSRCDLGWWWHSRTRIISACMHDIWRSSRYTIHTHVTPFFSSLNSIAAWLYILKLNGSPGLYRHRKHEGYKQNQTKAIIITGAIISRQS